MCGACGKPILRRVGPEFIVLYRSFTGESKTVPFHDHECLRAWVGLPREDTDTSG